MLLLKHIYQRNTLTFDAYDVHVSLMGEQDILTSPMICNAKLHAIINNEGIDSLILCYLLPPSLYPTVCVSEVSKDKSSHATSSCTSLIKHNSIQETLCE